MGKKGFWMELVELEKLGIFFFFSISEGPDAASEKLYLTQWAGKPCENSSLGPVLKHKSFCSWLQMKP